MAANSWILDGRFILLGSNPEVNINTGMKVDPTDEFENRTQRLSWIQPIAPSNSTVKDSLNVFRILTYFNNDLII